MSRRRQKKRKTRTHQAQREPSADPKMHAEAAPGDTAEPPSAADRRTPVRPRATVQDDVSPEQPGTTVPPHVAEDKTPSAALSGTAEAPEPVPAQQDDTPAERDGVEEADDQGAKAPAGPGFPNPGKVAIARWVEATSEQPPWWTVPDGVGVSMALQEIRPWQTRSNLATFFSRRSTPSCDSRSPC